MDPTNFEDEDLSYLQPEFDASSLTVARLRNVLLTHGISYPSSSKKADLVGIFDQQLKPQARKILAARRRTQRSSKGIEDAASTQIESQADDDVEPPQSSPAKRRGRPRKEDAAAANEVETEKKDEVKEKKKKARSVSRKAKDPDAPKSVKRSTSARTPSAAVTPGLKKEPSDPATWRKFDDDSPFSAENPFQSGSSPPVPATDGRRKTDGAAKERRRATSRRKTEEAPRRRSGSTIVRQSETVIDVPVASIVDDDVGTDAGDELDSEQAALDAARRRARLIVPVRRSKASATTWTRGVLAIAMVFLACFGQLWRQEKFTVGYCGIGHPSERIAGMDVPEWADGLRPSCETCPQHAICLSDLETECDKGFVLRHHPLSLGGLLPLPPTCEADGETAKRVKAVADRIVDELRDRKAKVECQEVDETGNCPTSPEIDEASLKAKISSQRRKGMSEEEFNSLFDEAIGEASGREEVLWSTDESGKRHLQSTSLAKVSLRCSVERSIRLTVDRYSRPALALVLVLASLAVAAERYTANQKAREDAKTLIATVFDRLGEHADYHHASGAGDGFVSVNQLRDDVLRGEFSSARRKRLWGHVESLVEQNSNVRTKFGALDTGDVGRGWKWIGDTGAGGGSRRGSARFSFNPNESAVRQDSSPMTEVDTSLGGARRSFTPWDATKRPQF